MINTSETSTSYAEILHTDSYSNYEGPFGPLDLFIRQLGQFVRDMDPNVPMEMIQ